MWFTSSLRSSLGSDIKKVPPPVVTNRTHYQRQIGTAVFSEIDGKSRWSAPRRPQCGAIGRTAERSRPNRPQVGPPDAEAVAKSSPDSRNVRFVIVRRSPDQVLKVGLLASRSEKTLTEYAGLGPVVRSLQSDIVWNCREYGHVSRISRDELQIFSAVKTVWRRGRDSNPRYRC